MSGRDPHEEHRAATPLELLFDLTFVVAFGTPPTSSPTPRRGPRRRRARSASRFATFAICWAWINFSWFASAYDTDDWLYRLDDHGADDRRPRPGARPAADVRVDRARRARRQRGDGRRLRRDAGRDGGPVAARGPQDPTAAPAASPTRCRLASRRSAGSRSWLVAHVGHGRPSRVVAVLDRWSSCRARSSPSAAWAARRGTPPHRRALRPARDHRARRGHGRHRGDLSALVDAQGWTGRVLVAVAGIGLTFGMWWIYFIVPSAEILHAHRERSFCWGYGQVSFGAIVGVGAGLHVAAYYLEQHSERARWGPC